MLFIETFAVNWNSHCLAFIFLIKKLNLRCTYVSTMNKFVCGNQINSFLNSHSWGARKLVI